MDDMFFIMLGAAAHAGITWILASYNLITLSARRELVAAACFSFYCLVMLIVKWLS